ncbi:MAG: hypothetical protein LRY27_04560 [Chitinophagales bacterium]|nr:hypothetical protein [Chitinophagales bacterium]
MYVFMGFNRNFILLYIAYGLIGFANAGIRVLRTTFIFRVIDNHIIGRTGSIFTVFNVIFRLIFITLFSLPFFAKGSNMVYSMYILAFFILLGSIILLLSYRKLRSLNNH